MTKRRFAWSPLVVSAASAVLLLSGCSGGGDPEPDVQDAVVEEPEEQPEDADSQDKPAEPEEADIVDMQVDQSVFYAGIEYEYESMQVTDLDEEAGNEDRMLGLELTFDFSAYNPGSDTEMPNAPAVLRWNEDGGENVAEINGQADVKQVPGDSSTSGEMVFTLAPDLLESYDEDSAHLILGHSGEANPVIALGAAAETVDRFPVPQEQIDDEEIVAGPLTITFDEVFVRWNYGIPRQGQTPDDEALLAMYMTIENTSDSQACSRRSAGKTMVLKDEDGNGYVDLGLTERCFKGGTSEEVMTAIEIPEEYEGTYNLEFDVDQVGDAEETGDIDIELVMGDGVAPSASR